MMHLEPAFPRSVLVAVMFKPFSPRELIITAAVCLRNTELQTV